LAVSFLFVLTGGAQGAAPSNGWYGYIATEYKFERTQITPLNTNHLVQTDNVRTLFRGNLDQVIDGHFVSDETNAFAHDCGTSGVVSEHMEVIVSQQEPDTTAGVFSVNGAPLVPGVAATYLLHQGFEQGARTGTQVVWANCGLHENPFGGLGSVGANQVRTSDNGDTIGQIPAFAGWNRLAGSAFLVNETAPGGNVTRVTTKWTWSLTREPDLDYDGIPDAGDNCPPAQAGDSGAWNPEQEDGDHDGVGDVCDDAVPPAEPCDGVTFSEVRGTPPQTATLAAFANDDAVCEAIWVPFVKDGLIPQGIALEGDSVLVSGYFEGQKRVRVMRVDLATGDPLQYRDLTFEHGGGIALDGLGGLWIADTQQLWRFDRATFFGMLSAGKKWKLGSSGKGNNKFDLRGSFLTFDAAGDVWIGTWSETGPSRLFEFPLQYLGSHTELTPAAAATQLTLPTKAQGAAFHNQQLWVSSSTSTWGRLSRGLTPYGFGPGSEEIEFDSSGDLWAVFEAGAGTYTDEFFPVVARFDTDRIDEVLAFP